MKKIIAAALTVAISLSVFYLVGTGFMKQTSVVLTDYSESEDGTEITLHVAVASSMGYIRDYKDEGGGVKPHYLKFYSTFGGLNSSFGSENSFALDIAQDDTEIYFYQGDGGYRLVLKKNDQTGVWEVPKYPPIKSSSRKGLVKEMERKLREVTVCVIIALK